MLSSFSELQHYLDIMKMSWNVQHFHKTSLFCSFNQKVPPFTIEFIWHSYFFHTMDLNCFKKKKVTCSPAWISGEMCLRPELFLNIWFFQYLFNWQVLHLYLLVSILPCLTSGLSLWQTMLYFHLGIGNLKYLVLRGIYNWVLYSPFMDHFSSIMCPRCSFVFQVPWCRIKFSS